MGLKFRICSIFTVFEFVVFFFAFVVTIFFLACKKSNNGNTVFLAMGLCGKGKKKLKCG